PFGEPERVLVPEAAAPELVPRRAIGDEGPEPRHMRSQARAAERLGGERRLPRLLPREPMDVARREVRARLLQGAVQELVGVGREDVVAVEERQEAAACRIDPGVARLAEPTVALAEEAEAPV